MAWALVPLLSLGLLSWTPFLYVAIRTRARRWRRATIAYLALAVLLGILVTIVPAGSHPINRVVGLLLLLAALVSCLHTLAIRDVYRRELVLLDRKQRGPATTQAGPGAVRRDSSLG